MSGLLDVALQAHGERWREVQSLDVRVSLTGGLYRLKGYPNPADASRLGKPVQRVILSHGHHDHWAGLEVLADRSADARKEQRKPDH
jgi:glyoxylase-like metal-dependent hydrolase (beta-lactamase superfamily II)